MNSSKPKFNFLLSTLFSYELLDLERTQTFAYTRRLTPHYISYSKLPVVRLAKVELAQGSRSSR